MKSFSNISLEATAQVGRRQGIFRADNEIIRMYIAGGGPKNKVGSGLPGQLLFESRII